MLDNPTVTGASRQLDAQDRRDRRAAQAFGLLVSEFIEAFEHGGAASISAHRSTDGQRLICDIVFELLADEHDLHTLRQLMHITRLARESKDASILAESIVSSLAHRYAEHEIACINDDGGFDE